MARIPDAFLDELLARTDIVEIVGARVQLKKQGREYAACCPFHDERSPSFTVSPSKQFYHCFGCGAHGSAISFLMDYDRLEFLDAVEELAKRAGMEIPRDTRQKAANPDTQPLFNALEAAQRFFHKQLAQSPQAQAYLQDRGVDAATAEAFGIGYAPAGFSALKDALGTDERRMQLLEKAGMFSRNERGHVYDKFRHRLMFPIHDRRGRVIAFGGRVLSSEDSPKYLNSPETPLFHKGRELYGLWQVRQANKSQRLIVVEGYMDVVALFQHGLPEAVATLGTATTPEHAELLFRNAPDVYFCFDGDAAGRRAASRAMHSVLPRMRDGRQAFFLFLPDGEDPDSLVRKEGIAGFNQRLQQALPLSQFFFDALSADVQLHTLEGKSRLAERAKPLLAQIPEGAFADLMQARLAELTGLAARTQTAPPAARPQTGHAAATPKRSLVREVITLLLQQPELALQAPVPYPFAELQQPGVALLIELLDLIRQRPGIQTAALLEVMAAHPHTAALHKLAMTELPGEPQTWQTVFSDALAQLTRQANQQRLEQLQRRMAEVGHAALSAAEKNELKHLFARLTQNGQSDGSG
ncbi:DNA primase [Lysobacteraceae bacterium NML03-0222]|nr:DNA primase [Xanthomonadaceae bacterium NML03-0222]